MWCNHFSLWDCIPPEKCYWSSTNLQNHYDAHVYEKWKWFGKLCANPQKGNLNFRAKIFEFFNVWTFPPKMYEMLWCLDWFEFSRQKCLKCIYEISEMSFYSLNFRAKNIQSNLMGCYLSNVKSKKWFDSEQCHKQVVNKSSVKYVGTKCVPWLSKKLVRINPKQ